MITLPFFKFVCLLAISAFLGGFVLTWDLARKLTRLEKEIDDTKKAFEGMIVTAVEKFEKENP